MIDSWPWSCPPAVDPARLAGFPDPEALRLAMSVPLPGRGDTVGRMVTLSDVAAIDLSKGRLVEGHLDALAILAEADRDVAKHATRALGVWAAGGPAVKAAPEGDRWQLTGRKPWCSGASILDEALVTAGSPDGDLLALVSLHQRGIRPDPASWPAVGMAASDTLDVDVDVLVGDADVIGPPGWYTRRGGFWTGSVGVAACWLGGAIGAVRAVASRLARRHPDEHQLAALGSAAARCAALAATVERAAGTIDRRKGEGGRTLALGVRQAVEEGCLSALLEVQRAGGADHLAHDADQARRVADLPVYVRQHHGARDAAAFASGLLEEGLGS